MGEERKWERKMGWGKYFPLLGWGENGRGKKRGEEKLMGHMPHFPPKFFLPKWGIIRERKVAQHCPITMSHLTHPFSFLSIFPHSSKHDEG